MIALAPQTLFVAPLLCPKLFHVDTKSYTRELGWREGHTVDGAPWGNINTWVPPIPLLLFPAFWLCKRQSLHLHPQCLQAGTGDRNSLTAHHCPGHAVYCIWVENSTSLQTGLHQFPRHSSTMLGKRPLHSDWGRKKLEIVLTESCGERRFS